MSRNCEVCGGKDKIELQYAPGVGNWFPGQCHACEDAGKMGASGITHSVESIKAALEDDQGDL